MTTDIAVLRGLVLMALILPFGLLAAAEGDAEKPVVPSLFPGGHTDRRGSIGYLEADGSAIAAVDLATGKELWRTKGPTSPLLATDDALLVLVQREGKLVTCSLDPATGKPLRESEPIKLPPWGDSRVHVGSSAVVVKGTLLLWWTATEDRGGGAAPRSVAGCARIDLGTGKVETAHRLDRTAGPPPAGPPPAFAKTIGGLTFEVATVMEHPSPNVVVVKRTLRAITQEGMTAWERALPTTTHFLGKP